MVAVKEAAEKPCACAVCINGSANGRMLDGSMKGSMRVGFLNILGLNRASVEQLMLRKVAR